MVNPAYYLAQGQCKIEVRMYHPTRGLAILDDLRGYLFCDSLSVADCRHRTAFWNRCHPCGGVDITALSKRWKCKPMKSNTVAIYLPAPLQR